MTTPRDFQIRGDAGERRLETALAGDRLLSSPLLNKGTAFTEAEREAFELRGLLPARVLSIEEQAGRILENLGRKESALEKYVDLTALLDRNETLFYRVLVDHLEDLLPIVYTPTVGEACQRFGQLFRRGRGIYLTLGDRGRVAEVLRRWPRPQVRVIVVTDGERILGLGDLGVNGMGIPIGKLSLYVAAGGVHPAEVLPVCLDTGTNNEELRQNPLYLGIDSERVRGEVYDALVEEFVEAAREVFPGVLVQFEDFAERNAQPLLERYRDRALCFNDDIQGTGAVALAALLAAERVTGRPLADEKVVIAGAGSAGQGIAAQIAAAMAAEGLSEDEAKKRIWITDSQGLVTRARGEIPPRKRRFAREGDAPASLEELVRRLEPTVLIGVSGQKGIFNEEMLSHLADRPLVLPLSNPTANSECTPEEAARATGGQALVATGSPFAGASQCNNVYVFPGIGLGAITAGAERITDTTFLAAAKALAARTAESRLERGLLLPPLTEIREISAQIAADVIAQEGADAEVEQWQPIYLPYRRV